LSDLIGVHSGAEGAFVRRYQEIFRFVRRRTVTQGEAEDLTQEVFADAVQALGPLLAEAPPNLAWLYTVARRRLVDAARTESRRRARRSEAVLELVPASPSEYGPAVARAMTAAIAELPASQRDVVVRKVLQGQSFAEIATALRTTEAACKMRFARGLEAIRSELVRQGIEP
jgi:RNA polymerase sigma factor (sigma-70 family)